MHTLLDLHNVLTILEGHLPPLHSSNHSTDQPSSRLSPTDPPYPSPSPTPYSIVGIRLGFYPSLPPRYRATFSIAPNAHHPHRQPHQPLAICDVTLLLYLEGHVLCWDFPPDEPLPPSVAIGGEPGPLYRSLPSFTFLDG